MSTVSVCITLNFVEEIIYKLTIFIILHTRLLKLKCDCKIIAKTGLSVQVTDHSVVHSVEKDFDRKST